MGLANEGMSSAGEEKPRVAPDGFLWVCMACGKRVRDRYSEEGGWDESCFLNSELIAVERLGVGANGRVAVVKDK